MYNIGMKIEIESVEIANTTQSFWGQKGYRGMDGGKIAVKFDNDSEYQFNVQDFVFYVVHRSEGEGFTKVIKK